MKRTFPVFILLLVLAFISSCEFPKMKPMQMKEDFFGIQAKLTSPENFEQTGISNTSNTRNGVTVNSIEINLLNGKNLPRHPDSLQAIAKRKAKIVADEIGNPEDYANITVNIKTESKSGLISKSTRRSFSFSFAELKTDSVPSIDSLPQDSVIIHSPQTE
jgi:hypothetical protein